MIDRARGDSVALPDLNEPPQIRRSERLFLDCRDRLHERCQGVTDALRAFGFLSAKLQISCVEPRQAFEARPRRRFTMDRNDLVRFSGHTVGGQICHSLKAALEHREALQGLGKILCPQRAPNTLAPEVEIGPVCLAAERQT